MDLHHPHLICLDSLKASLSPGPEQKASMGWHRGSSTGREVRGGLENLLLHGSVSARTRCLARNTSIPDELEKVNRAHGTKIH